MWSNFSNCFTPSFWDELQKKLLHNLSPHLKSVDTLRYKIWIFSCFLGRLLQVDRAYVHLSTKCFSDSSEIWHSGRGQWVMHEVCHMACSKLKVKVTWRWKLEILPFAKSISSVIFNGRWQMTADSLTRGQWATSLFDLAFCWAFRWAKPKAER